MAGGTEHRVDLINVILFSYSSKEAVDTKSSKVEREITMLSCWLCSVAGLCDCTELFCQVEHLNCVFSCLVGIPL